MRWAKTYFRDLSNAAINMQIRSLLSFILLALASAEEEQQQPRGNLRRATKQVDLSENRIIGGIKVESSNKKFQFPFFISTGQCGATLVAPDVVMTAAHCYNTIRSRVLVGALKEGSELTGNAQYRDVVPGSLQKHPRYNSVSQQYDMMLFKIQAVTKPHLKPVKLNRSGRPQTQSKLTAIGTGALNPAGTMYGPDLRMVDINAVSHQECQRKYGRINIYAQVCASAPKKDTCYGDSGGPLLNQKGEQVGITSYGADCADPYYPGVYTLVGKSTIGWLERQICSISDHKPAFCNRVHFKAVVQYDLFPLQSGWFIKDLKTKKIVAGIRPGRVRKRGARVKKSINLVQGRSYALTMQDRKSNGFNKGRRGFVAILGEKITSSRPVWSKKAYGRFRRKKVVKFTVPRLNLPPNQAPT